MVILCKIKRGDFVSRLFKKLLINVYLFFSLGNGDLCLENSLSSCSPSTTRSLKTIYQLVKMMGQLSGVCSLHPLDCSPDLAVGCMSDLEETTKQKIHYGNTDRICR